MYERLAEPTSQQHSNDRSQLSIALNIPDTSRKSSFEDVAFQ
jgi:hypothetical protein